MALDKATIAQKHKKISQLTTMSPLLDDSLTAELLLSTTLPCDGVGAVVLLAAAVVGAGFVDSLSASFCTGVWTLPPPPASAAELATVAPDNSSGGMSVNQQKTLYINFSKVLRESGHLWVRETLFQCGELSVRR